MSVKDSTPCVYDVFSPTASKISIRIAIVIALTLNWICLMFDCKSAFLQAGIDEPLFIRPPPSYLDLVGSNGGKPNMDLVFRLRRSLYGLKTASRRWYKHLCKILQAF